MNISLYAILIIYLVIMLMFLVFSTFNFYHLWRFGLDESTNYFMMGLYFLLLVVVITASWHYASSVDWSQPIL